MPMYPSISRRRRARDVDALLQIPTFAFGDRRRLAELAAHTDRLRLPPGCTLVEAGATARELIVVVGGEAAVLHGDGTREVLGAGAAIGGTELLAHERHTATVVATSTLDVVVVNGPAVRWAHAEGLAELAPPASRPVAWPVAVLSPRPGRQPDAELAS